MKIQISPQKNMDKKTLFSYNETNQQQQIPVRNQIHFSQNRANGSVQNNTTNMLQGNQKSDQINAQNAINHSHNQGQAGQKGTNIPNNVNSNANNNQNAAANNDENINNIDVKVHPELQLSQQDFEKKFIKTADKCLNKCDFYETWKYEMNGEIYIVKKYLKLDDMKWKKLVNSYNLQYHLACSNSLFLKPFKLVAFSLATVTSAHHNRLSHTNVHHVANSHLNQQNTQSQYAQYQQQQIRRWHLYVIYPFSIESITLDKIYQSQTASVSDTDLICLAIQLFKIGQLCAEKNFPLINWKFSNLLVELKSSSIQIFQPNYQQPVQTLSTQMIKTQRLQTETNQISSQKPSLKLVEYSLKIMDLYDYFGIENRDSNDLLLPPELRQDQRKSSATVHFEDFHGSLEQSSIYMTGMILAQLLIKNFEESRKADDSILYKKSNKLIATPQQPQSASINKSVLQKKAINNNSIQQSVDETKKKNTLNSSSLTQSNDFSQLQNIQNTIDLIIETQSQVNPLIHALAMIVKFTITPNPKERYSFSSVLDVIRDLFGEIIDQPNSDQSQYKKFEKNIIMLLEFTNTLLEQQDYESASNLMNRAKKILILKSKKYQLSPIVNAYYFFSTSNLLMLQGRLAHAVRNYLDGLREIQQIQIQYEEYQDDLYYKLHAQILLQLGICSFKLNQYYKSRFYIEECIIILKNQEKYYKQPHIKNSLRCKYFEMNAFALMWRAQIERIIGVNNDTDYKKLEDFSSNKKSDFRVSDTDIQSEKKINESIKDQKQEPIELLTIKEALKYVPKGTRSYAKIVLVKAKILSSKGFTEKALKYVNKQQEQLESQNQNKVTDLLIMECNYIKGIIYFQKENIPESIKHFQLAQQIYEQRGEANHPDCSAIYQKLAKCYARLGKISQASSLHERAMLLNDLNLAEASFQDSRFLKQSTEEPECLLTYNYCLHLKEQGLFKQSKEFTHELMQNYKYFLSPAPEFVNKLLDYHYTNLNLKIKITKS
ncbi:tetratricopeptide repeat protein (macronuclear) [Tetrahymena thermophila SB210]|uniref:Tetratricopeptide repeat protein n=1 Tax=Tetrahymena thermophila (strain SB210) TaxID=312017 RepID=Q22B51_TETTS|nr:tetratricopeptide repeat protein [Tetrahymena thermophila SB210]EAR82504.2 tetratricopeptide repeat protein [Tetrahymena thermophila SB210]|eukprot:XP_001030167.2 tetratricopeptide repeat protein [Tetrahymena thermophila SB210]